MKRHNVCHVLGLSCAAAVTLTSPAGDDAYVTAIESYASGSPEPVLTDPQVVIGSPTRMTGLGAFPGVVSIFNPPWSETDIVSIGPGGHLTVSFDTPIADDPANPFGIDLLIFGNTGFIDTSYPQGIIGGVFGDDGGTIEVSADGKTWHELDNVQADSLFPTQGYLDSGPYDEREGDIPTDFTKPVDPAIAMDDLLGLDFDEAMTLYDGSGGGAGIDIASTGLSEVSYVRISNASNSGVTVDIDALSRVSPDSLPTDLNGDGVVNVSDMLILLDAWGAATPGKTPADFNDDGQVNVSDLLILLADWG